MHYNCGNYMLYITYCNPLNNVLLQTKLSFGIVIASLTEFISESVTFESLQNRL
jgi:hypothetical protein